MLSNIFFLVHVLRFTPNHTPLIYRCPFKIGHWVGHISQRVPSPTLTLLKLVSPLTLTWVQGIYLVIHMLMSNKKTHIVLFHLVAQESVILPKCRVLNNMTFWPQISYYQGSWEKMAYFNIICLLYTQWRYISMKDIFVEEVCSQCHTMWS